MDLFSLCDRYIQLSTFILFLVTHFCIFYIWFLPSYFDFCFVGERFGVQASSQKLELVTYYPSPHLFYPTPHPHISYTCSNSLIHPNLHQSAHTPILQYTRHCAPCSHHLYSTPQPHLHQQLHPLLHDPCTNLSQSRREWALLFIIERSLCSNPPQTEEFHNILSEP